ncbi:MAG: hypothetical protein GX225_02515 [Clostridiales bacterium]|nr:hypothetical protein [Clostridiales bacterium]
MEEKVIILSADAWRFTDEKTGELKTGCSCFYVSTQDLTKPKFNSDTSFGYKPLKASMPEDFISKIKQAGGVPLKATAKYIMRVSNGQQVLKVDEFII